MKINATAPRPLVWRVLPRATVTVACATIYALYRSVRAGLLLPIAVVGLFLVAGGVSVAAFGPVGLIGPILLLGLAALLLFPIAAMLLVSTLVLPRRHGWTDASGSIVITTVDIGNDAWTAANLSCWPIGKARSRSFMRALLVTADRDGVTVRSRAGNQKLFVTLYEPLGFRIVRPGGRPRMERPPRSVPKQT